MEKKKMKNLNLLSLCLFLLFSGCISEEEKEVRRGNAFDLSGRYQTLGNSEVDMNFEIVNEEEGNHNIAIALERVGVLVDKEKTFLSELERNHGIVIPLEEFSNRFFIVALGKGSPFLDFSGGENISDDFGKSSRFFVCSSLSDYESNKVDKINPKLKINYCLSGTIEKGSNIVVGNVELSASTYYDIENGGVGVSSDGKIDLKYKAKRIDD